MGGMMSYIIDIVPYLNKYFEKKMHKHGYEYALNEEIKREVEFITEDVIKGHEKTWKYDIIFCRYLLIYISRENRDKFLKIIENKLAPGGLLILGKTETLFHSFPKKALNLIDARNHIYMKSN